jgi:hypothetical protein
MSKVMGMFGLLDFTCYGPFSFGPHFETYELFISLIFKFVFLVRGFGGTALYIKNNANMQHFMPHQ